jgi:hypothetical protein
MKKSLRTLALATLTVVGMSLSACNGNANIAVPAGLLSASGSIQDAFTSIETSAQLRAVGPDLQPYRAESDPGDSTIWVVYYWSPSMNKSYRCRTSARNHQVIDIVQTTDTNQVYQADYKIEKSQVKVSSDSAAAAAVASINANNNNSATTSANATTTTNNNTTNTTTTAQTSTVNNITVNNITNVQVISPKECKDRTGRSVTAPVYVFVTANNKAYVDAATGQTIVTTSASTTNPVPTATPAPATSTTPIVLPSTAVTVAATLSANLSAALEVPPTTSSGNGSCTVKLSADNQSLTLSGTVNNLTTPITGAHIHVGGAGATGEVVKTLTVSGNTFSATWTAGDSTQPLTPTLVTALLNGGLYVNVHTTANPNGEVRGQLLASN